jgi:hypothetical protein
VSFFVRGFWRGYDLQHEMKRRVAEEFGDKMREHLAKSRPVLENAIDEMMRPFIDNVTKAFGDEIDDEIRSLRLAQQRNALSRDEKEKLIVEYEKIGRDVNAQGDVLLYVMKTSAVM